MTTPRLFLHALAGLSTLFLVNCANKKPITPEALAGKKETFVNPFPAGTYDHFKADPSFPKTFGVWKNEELLSRTDASNSSIKVNLSIQRATLMNGEEIAMDYPICSGTAERPTPTGTFYILEKIVDKKSNRYGKFLDAAGEVVDGNADAVLGKPPAGGSFAGAPMRYWMRLTNDGVGHHIGPIRRVASSHACVRGPSATIPIVYSKVKVGTRVVIE